MTTQADRIRSFVNKEYVEPARRRGESSVTVRAGDVHRALGLKNRVPLVCSALRGKKFLDAHGLRIAGVEGPPSEQSTTVEITYSLLPRVSESPASLLHTLVEARGIAKQLFTDLGGGEAFIRQMREDFFGPEQSRPFRGDVPAEERTAPGSRR